MSANASPKIDVHAHFLPPFYRTACSENGHEKPDGMPAVPEWSEAAHLELMDRMNITKSFLSISTPGTHLDVKNQDLATQLARDTNAFAAELKRRKPERFGYFAFLPIPEIDFCVEEIRRSAEEGCDGFVLLTNGHGHYLGDVEFDPIFAELNRRKAIVFIHPTTPCLKCATDTADAVAQHATPLSGKYPNPMLEFFFDTTRAIANLFLSGTIQRCPDIRFIIPGLGGATPSLLSRWTGFSTFTSTPRYLPS
jgi:predicted TIM-barrel fold metal-dependent hydrolase